MGSRQISNLKIALPKGHLLPDTAELIDRAEWAIDGYVEEARSYRLQSGKFPGLLAKIFHEKDIPIQVAIGNYDLGICGLDWVEELTAKFPSVDIIELRNLGYGEGRLYMAASRSGVMTDIKTMREADSIIRIVSEYPNMAESFALKNRLRRFSVFSLWGAAGAYPPESAELALIREGEEVPDLSSNSTSQMSLERWSDRMTPLSKASSTLPPQGASKSRVVRRIMVSKMGSSL